MEVVKVKTHLLKHAEYNPRKINEKEMNDLKNSLIKFGFVEPVVANKAKGRKNVIVGGHQRVKAWEQLGHDEVPVYYVDLTEAKEKELNIRLNKNGGQFDFDLLAEFYSKDELLEFGFEQVELIPMEEVEIPDFDQLPNQGNKDNWNVKIQVPNEQEFQKLQNALPIGDNKEIGCHEVLKYVTV